MEYSPLLVPFLQLLGIVVLLALAFGLTLLFISAGYGEKKSDVIDVEFTEVPPQKPYESGSIVDKKA
tara:strand:+ start:383385 stop:383585 length:201 start_codon:yes stop_codon:yes gene_type:complete